jgi:hypothetical protein
MKRIATPLLLLLALAFPAWAGPKLPEAAPLLPSPAFTPSGPATARGALVWLHGSYDTDTNPTPPKEPDWVGRMARRGWDIWRFDRTPGSDPLAPGGENLIIGLRALRANHYGKIIVAGHSRGAWISLRVLREAELADAVAVFAAAAFGTREARRALAMADWTAMLAAAAPAVAKLALVQFADDPLDLEAAQRRNMVLEMCARAKFTCLSLFQPPEPRGHDGVYEKKFDEIFGAQLVAFLDPP